MSGDDKPSSTFIAHKDGSISNLQAVSTIRGRIQFRLNDKPTDLLLNSQQHVCSEVLHFKAGDVITLSQTYEDTHCRFDIHWIQPPPAVKPAPKQPVTPTPALAIDDLEGIDSYKSTHHLQHSPHLLTDLFTSD